MLSYFDAYMSSFAARLTPVFCQILNMCIAMPTAPPSTLPSFLSPTSWRGSFQRPCRKVRSASSCTTMWRPTIQTTRRASSSRPPSTSPAWSSSSTSTGGRTPGCGWIVQTRRWAVSESIEGTWSICRRHWSISTLRKVSFLWNCASLKCLHTFKCRLTRCSGCTIPSFLSNPSVELDFIAQWLEQFTSKQPEQGLTDFMFRSQRFWNLEGRWQQQKSGWKMWN